MKKVFILLMLLVFANVSYSQSLSDNLKNNLDSKEKLKLEGYLMPLYVHSNEFNGFQINYLRIKGVGMLNEFLGYYLQFDFAKTPTLKDATIDIKINDFLKIRVGQFKYHFGAYEKPWNFPTIFNPEVKSVMFGDPRDIGIELSGSNNNLDYYLYVLNGTERGIAEDDKKKTKLASFDYNVNADLKFGISQYWGTRNFIYQGELTKGAKRNRSSIYFWYDNEKLLLQGESIWGMDHTYDQKGHCIVLGYHLNKKVQPVFRYDYFESDILDITQTTLAIGINFYFNEQFYLRSIVEFKNTGDNFTYGKSAIELGFMFFK